MPRWGSKRFVSLSLLGAVLLIAALVFAVPGLTGPGLIQPAPAAAQGTSTGYVILGWNDLGMHCYDGDYATLAVLPPYNTLWAQVIRMGEEPHIVTRGVTVEYSVPGNTRSDNKTNFWEYAEALFGTALEPNVGLTGNGLSGTMELRGDHFVAEGIPLTEFPDDALDQPNYFQLAHLVAKDSASGAILAEADVVAPVSSEMRCDTCHGENGQDFRLNILQVHDQNEGTDLVNQRPVLCANCHADPALGLTGQPDVSTLSGAMHTKHAGETEDVDPTKCYACHPGENTQCLRGVHADQENLWCTDCHGDLSAVAEAVRRPWQDLPLCGDCHDPQFAENPGTLYRNSTGHGRVYCEACHNSTHAIWPSGQANDNVEIIALQGHASTLNDCAVCHGGQPREANEGPHQGGGG